MCATVVTVAVLMWVESFVMLVVMAVMILAVLVVVTMVFVTKMLMPLVLAMGMVLVLMSRTMMLLGVCLSAGTRWRPHAMVRTLDPAARPAQQVHF